MALIARIAGWSLLSGGLGAGLGLVFFGRYSDWLFSEYVVPTVLLGCVGGIIGVIAGAAREIVTALRKGPPSKRPGVFDGQSEERYCEAVD